MKKILVILTSAMVLGLCITPFLNLNVKAGTITVLAQNYITGSSTVEWNFNNEGWNSFTANPASSEPYDPPTTPIVYTITSDGSFFGDGTTKTLEFRFRDPNTGSWATYYDGHHSGGSGWYNYQQVSSTWDWTGDKTIFISVPYEPYNPQPATSASNQPVDVDISWTSEQTNPSYPGAIAPEPNGANMGNTYYDIFFGPTNPPPYVAYKSYTSGVNTYDPGTLSESQTYYWQIIAYADTSMGGYTGTSSPVWSFTTGGGAGDTFAPTIDSFTPLNADSVPSVDVTVQVSDTGGSGLNRYCYAWTNSPSKPPAGPAWSSWDTSISGNSDSFVISKSDPGTWYLHVEVEDGALNRGYDYSGQYILGVSNTDPHVPYNENPSDGTSGQSIDVDLSWQCADPDGDPLTYDVYFEASDSSPDIVVSNGQSSKTYDPGTLEFDTHYYWKIIAEDDNGGMTAGPVWDFWTGTEEDPPPDPVNLYNPTEVTSSSMRLSWSQSTDSDYLKYEIHKSTTSGFTPGLSTLYDTISNKATTSRLISGLSAATTYYYKIKTYDSSNQYAISNQVSGTTSGSTGSQEARIEYAIVNSIPAQASKESFNTLGYVSPIIVGSSSSYDWADEGHWTYIWVHNPSSSSFNGKALVTEVTSPSGQSYDIEGYLFSEKTININSGENIYFYLKLYLGNDENGIWTWKIELREKSGAMTWDTIDEVTITLNVQSGWAYSGPTALGEWKYMDFGLSPSEHYILDFLNFIDYMGDITPISLDPAYQYLDITYQASAAVKDTALIQMSETDNNDGTLTLNFEWWNQRLLGNQGVWYGLNYDRAVIGIEIPSYVTVINDGSPTFKEEDVWHDGEYYDQYIWVMDYTDQRLKPSVSAIGEINLKVQKESNPYEISGLLNLMLGPFNNPSSGTIGPLYEAWSRSVRRYDLWSSNPNNVAWHVGGTDKISETINPDGFNILNIIGFSPINICITDPEGRMTGYDRESSTLVIEIPDSYYSGPETEPEIICVKNTTSKFKLDIIGTDVGDYHIKIQKIYESDYKEYWINGTISEEVVVSNSINMSPTSFWNSPLFLGLIVLMVCVGVTAIIWKMRKRTIT